MKNTVISLLYSFLFIWMGTACSNNDHPSSDAKLAVSKPEITLSAASATTSFHIQTNVDWTITGAESWCTVTPSSGSGTGTIEITVSVTENTSFTQREGTIRFTVGSITETVTIRQSGQEISIPADPSGMASDALTLAANMQIGCNLGNSLEACSGTTAASETMWGNPRTGKALIDAVKAAGFNTVRIPCAWSGYIEDESTYKIRESWLARVKEVVDYCIDNDMYAIINIHWDGGWLEEHPFYSHQEEVNKKQKALWEQIAVYFRDYDEHLLFAGTNEVHADYNAPTTEYVEVQNSYNQTFVDAVRSTGGRNAWRNLIVQAYNTNIDYAVKYLKMPTDPVANRMMAEVHYYDPYDFCLNENSSVSLWGKNYSGNKVDSWGQEDWVDEAFGLMKTNFVDKGIAVVLGEYGAILRTNAGAEHIEARHYYLNYVTQAALKNGLVPVYWDNGGVGNHSFGLFDRSAATPYYPETIRAITGVSL